MVGRGVHGLRCGAYHGDAPPPCPSLQQTHASAPSFRSRVLRALLPSGPPHFANRIATNDACPLLMRGEPDTSAPGPNCSGGTTTITLPLLPRRHAAEEAGGQDAPHSTFPGSPRLERLGDWSDEDVPARKRPVLRAGCLPLALLGLVLLLMAAPLILMSHRAGLLASSGSGFQGHGHPALAAATDDDQEEVPRVAVCVVGGIRSFPLPTIHESLRYHFLGRLHPAQHMDVFFDLSHSSDGEPGCRDMEVKYPNHTLDAALDKFHPVHMNYETPTCERDAFVAESSCCKYNAARKNGTNSRDWRSWDSYIRKAACFHEALAHEREHGLHYAWFVVVRPDLVFLEPVPFSLATLLPDRIYASSKEGGQPMGDYMYMVPRPLVHAFTRGLVQYADADCDRQTYPKWPPEFAFHPYLDRVGMLYQVLPILFVIIRCSGEAACARLRNEVFHNSALRIHGNRSLSAEKTCESLTRSPDFLPSFHPYVPPVAVNVEEGAEGEAR